MVMKLKWGFLERMAGLMALSWAKTQARDWSNMFLDGKRDIGRKGAGKAQRLGKFGAETDSYGDSASNSYRHRRQCGATGQCAGGWVIWSYSAWVGDEEQGGVLLSFLKLTVSPIVGHHFERGTEKHGGSVEKGDGVANREGVACQMACKLADPGTVGKKFR